MSAAYPPTGAPDLTQIGDWLQKLAEKELSLRDYFAAQALPVLINLNEQKKVEYQVAAAKLAACAYFAADAMLAERTKS